ncbi:MAG: dTMP kinase [Planctomycetota bacterium]
MNGAQRGLFVVLDGIDGCGKSTQAARLAEALGPATLHLREPGSTFLGEALRGLLLDPASRIDSGAETLLFAAARRQMLDEVVAPALEAGRDVVCERFNPSTFAYQAVAGALDEEAVLDLLAGWCTSPAPDLELLLTLDVDVAFARRGSDRDRIEQRGRDYQARVAEGYARYAERLPRARAIPAGAGADEVAAAVRAAVEEVRRAVR